jgi:DNA-binding transcriptional LysR family regulator
MADAANDMRLFVEILVRGSFAAAGEALGLTPSGASKAVSRLETRLGVRLLERTTRRLSPTSEGLRYAADARRILAEIEAAEAAVQASRGEPTGELRVNSGMAFATNYLAAALPEFHARWPKVVVELAVSDRRIDLIAENADVAIRTGPVGDERLIARQIGVGERVICAAPSYLARRGVPESPHELVHHQCLAGTQPGVQLFDWPFRFGGRTEHVKVRGSIGADNAATVLALALAGIGIVRMLDMAMADAIRRGDLVPLFLEEHEANPVPISAVYPTGRYAVPRLRVFVDFLVERFGDSPWRNPRPPAVRG